MPIISPNMDLPVPVVSTTPGPEYAVNVNDCLTTIDAHDHTTGSGVPITPAALNINATVPFGGNNATQLRTARFNAQGAPLTGSASADINCIYFAGVDMYANDGSGNTVRITQSGGVAGSPGSISNLTAPASAAYVAVSQTFVWQSGASTPANIDGASYIYRNLSVNSKGLTLSPPNAMAADYSLTLPAVPASTSFMTLTNGGVMGASIATTQGITKAMLVAPGQQISGTSGNFVSASASYVDVSNLTVTITTTGRPVLLMLMSAGSLSRISASNSSNGSALGRYQILRDASTISNCKFGQDPAASSANETAFPPMTHLDVPGSGTYTYKVQTLVEAGTSVIFNEMILSAIEL